MVEPFDLLVNFSYLNHSPLLPIIDSHNFDKSFLVELDIKPEISLRLRQDIYSFLLRCIDLNFSYSDYNEEQFSFRNEEEYFRSKEHLLKSKININSPLISLSLYTTESHDLFTQIYLKDPFVGVQQFLNKRYHFEIGISRLSMFYIKNLM